MMPLPSMLYGTAWKEDRTQALVELALHQGFRGIDTANQRKHYFEAAAGDAIAAAISGGQVTRSDLFLQTKFTFRHGQDDRLPYDPGAPIAQQVEQSFASSLEHLRTDWIDSYILHGPSQREGLEPADRDAWRAMESIFANEQARLLGVSNVTIGQLEQLWDFAEVKPAFVQNRCYAVLGWDREIREFCKTNGVIYQGFSLLTANRKALALPHILEIARRHGVTVSQVIFRFAMDVGMLPLTGTTDPRHMAEDLAVMRFHLSSDEITQIENLATE